MSSIPGDTDTLASLHLKGFIAPQSLTRTDRP
jgi:hypothetical protein